MMELWIRGQQGTIFTMASDYFEITRADLLPEVKVGANNQPVKPVPKFIVRMRDSVCDDYGRPGMIGLGMYNTELRAAEVLKQITDMFRLPLVPSKSYSFNKADGSGGVEYIQVPSSKPEIIQLDTYVFDMPKE